MFARKKMIRGKAKWYLVQSYRDRDGKPRQKVVFYLGEHNSIAARHDATNKQLRKLKKELDYQKKDTGSARTLARLEKQIEILKKLRNKIKKFMHAM